MNRLKELRKGRTQEYIANQLGIPRGTYRNYEAGTREPDQETLTKIADYFKVSVDYLLGRNEEHYYNNLIIPENLYGVPIAFSGGLNDLTQEDIDEISNYVEFIKQRKQNKGGK